MAISFPHDSNRVPAPNMTPNGEPVAITYDATISASTEITLNAATTFLEVTAIDKAILLNWGASDASITVFDSVIPANTTRFFFVPTGVAAVNFIEVAATAILVVIEK